MADLRDFFQGASNSVASNVSAPVDGIAWLLRKAGLPIPQNPVGGSDWMAQRGLTAEPQNKIAGLLGESFGGVAPMLAAAKAPQIAKGLLQAGDNLAAPRTLNPQTGAIVWHGSPHKFDKFDSSKIGTGEGAQAYGHGLYLAESQDVARTYTTSTNHVAKQDWVQIDGVPYRATQTRAEDTAHNVAADALSRFDYDKKAAMGWLENYGKDLEAKKIIKSAKKFGPTNDPATSMYQVDRPDEYIAKMLDWDKPLSQQAPEVRKVLQRLAEDGQDFYPTLKEMMQPFEAGNTTGQAVYHALQREGGNAVNATRELKSAGIPGIRYLDGGSRGAGQGSSNFVVFPGNEGLLSILERNGQALK